MTETKLYSLGELFATKFEDPPRRIGSAEFCPATQEIKLHVYQNGQTYDIDLARRLSLEAWLRHLNFKSWATSAVLGDFVKVWMQVNV